MNMIRFAVSGVCGNLSAYDSVNSSASLLVRVALFWAINESVFETGATAKPYHVW